MIETAAGQRRRRAIKGEGMVTPKQRLTIADDGEIVTLEPRRDRITVDHELVARNPDKFVACWNRDVRVRSVLCDYLERTLKPGGSTRTATSRPGVGGSALDVATQTRLGGSLNVRGPHRAL
jgi:hypothetical protein